MRSLVYAGKDFSEFKCWWDGSQIFRKPAKRIDKYSVPFRNGELFRSQYSFDNVQIVYNCFIKEDYQTNYSNLINYLNSFDKYQTLQNSVEADTYRMAIIHAEVEPTTGQFLKDGRFTLTFDCMPQEFLTSGDTPVNVSNVYKQYTGKTVYIDNPTGQSEVTLFRADFSPKQDFNGYDEPWVGGAGKNKLPTPYGDGASKTTNGITYTVNADGSVTANGTATANNVFYLVSASASALANKGIASGTYVLSGAPSTSTSSNYYIQAQINGDTWVTATASGATINYNATAGGNDLIRLYVVSGAVLNNVTFKPMLRLASVTDATYEPYENFCPITGWDTIPINTTSTSKNLLPSNVLFPETVSGVTFTPNMDYPPTREHGIITADGTATEDIELMIYEGLNLAEGEYILTGCPTQTFYNYWLGIYKNGEVVGTDVGEGFRFVVHSGESISVGLFVPSGQELLNVEFKPMIRVGTDTDSTYEPYSEEPIPLFTIDLNGTRYGGHVDATTGVLTVTHGFVTFDGSSDENWTLQTDGRRCAIHLTNCKNVEGIRRTIGAISNLYEEKYPIDTWNSVIGFSIEANGDLVVRQFTTNTMTVANFRTFLQSNPMQICYPLQTPQTVQLTAQQIELATGMNQYGTDTDGLTVTVKEPFTLVNPTLMESKPLIKIEQAGTYYLNGEQIIQTHGSGAVYPMYIDTETMDAYAYDQYGNRLNMNGYVDLPDAEIVLSSGENYFYSTASVTITPRWWRL